MCFALRLTDSLQDSDLSDPSQILDKLKSTAAFIRRHKPSRAYGAENEAVCSEIIGTTLSGLTGLLQNDDWSQRGKITPGSTVPMGQFRSELAHNDDAQAPVSLGCRRPQLFLLRFAAGLVLDWFRIGCILRTRCTTIADHRRRRFHCCAVCSGSR